MVLFFVIKCCSIYFLYKHILPFTGSFIIQKYLSERKQFFETSNPQMWYRRVHRNASQVPSADHTLPVLSYYGSVCSVSPAYFFRCPSPLTAVVYSSEILNAYFSSLHSPLSPRHNPSVCVNLILILTCSLRHLFLNMFLIGRRYFLIHLVLEDVISLCKDRLHATPEDNFRSNRHVQDILQGSVCSY